MFNKLLIVILQLVIIQETVTIMEFIDTHAHIYASEFSADRDEVLQKARKEGIKKIVLPAIDSNTHQSLIDLTQQHNDLFVPLIGLHPTSVKSDYKKELSQVENYLSEGSFFHGIGEIGIDLYWDKTYFKEQQDAFITQVRWAQERNWPIIIHTRDSFNEVYSLLKPILTEDTKGIFHCFGGSLEQANLIIEMGFKLGIGGVVTFKNSDLRDVLKNVDIKHIVLETDSPYLAPVPFRGKRNDSSYISIIAKQIAEVYKLPLEQVAQITTKNALDILKI